MAATSVFLVKESFGTYCLNGPPNYERWDKVKANEEEARFTAVSPNGNFVAIGINSSLNVFNTSDGQLKCTIRCKMLSAKFSPNGAYLTAWDNPSQNHDNFNIWSLNGDKNVNVVHSMKLSKQPDIHFSNDEQVYARMSNNSVIFSHVPDFHNTAKKTPETMKVNNFSLSTGEGPLHVLCFIPSTVSGQPSFARLFRYPNFENLIASKSFFQADRVDMKWNLKGNAVLLITSTDVDKTGQSYYGKTMLHYLDTKGETATVQTDNDAPVIHAAEWSPSSTEFCIITGKMPNTRAALLNCRCEKIFDMGISARNAIYFNPQGNLLLLCGFGNLGHGKIEVWEVKKIKRQIGNMTAPETTQLQWLNDGVHFVTATTAPRMQVGNSFKVWDFTGKSCYEWLAKKHLFGIVPFMSYPPLAFPDNRMVPFNKPVGNKANLSQIEGKKPAAYVPPSKRGKDGQGGVLTNPKANANVKGAGDTTGTVLTEQEKKVRAVKKKLEQIEKLKELVKVGKLLEKNQQEKLSKEESLLKELKVLQLS